MNNWPDRPAMRAAAALLLVWLLGGANAAPALDCPALVLNKAAPLPVRFQHGLLYRITGKGGTSHLFGTIHVSDPADPKIPPVVSAALVDSRSFVMEVLLDIATIQSMQSEMFFNDGTRLGDVVPPDVAAAAIALLAGHGIPAALANNMKPWAAFATLSMPAGPQTVPLDILLMQQAYSASLSLHGLETLAEQVRVFTSLPQPDQRALLVQSICHYGQAQAELKDLIAMYENRDLAGLMTLALRYASDPPELQDKFLDTLLWQRNDRMLTRVLPFLEQGDAFIAVGALHLPGKRGLLEQLEARGYMIEAVY